jgi:hypothetical protein
MQTRLAQSLSPPQVLPATHAAHAGPPQSVPDSVPFFAPSVHLGA